MLLPLDLLQELGLEVNEEDLDAFPFANDQNKALEQEIQQLRLNLNEVKDGIRREAERCAGLEEYTHQAKEDQKLLQRLIVSKEDELESEHAQMKLIVGEGELVKQEIARLEKEDAVYHQRTKNYEARLEKYAHRIGVIRRELRWDQTTADQWVKDMTKLDQDNLAVVKYAEVDNGKIKELVLELEKLGESLVSLREKYENAMLKRNMAVAVASSKMERASVLKKEQAELSKRWSDAMDVLSKRDMTIQQHLEDLDLLSDACDALRSDQDRQEKYLQRELTANKEAEETLEELRKKLERRKLELEEKKKKKEKLEEDVLLNDVQRKSSEAELQRSRDETELFTAESEGLDRKLRSLQTREQKLASRLEELQDLKTSSERKTELSEELLRESEAFNEDLFMQLNNLNRQKQNVTGKFSASQSRLTAITTKLKGKNLELKSLNEKKKEIEGLIETRENELEKVELHLSTVDRRLLLIGGAEKQEELQGAEFLVEKKRLLADIELKERECLEIEREKNQVAETNKMSITSLAKQDELIQRADDNLRSFSVDQAAHERMMKSIQARREEVLLERTQLHIAVKTSRKKLEDILEKIKEVKENRLMLEMESERERSSLIGQLELGRARWRLNDEEKRRLSLLLSGLRDRAKKLQGNYELTLEAAGAPPSGSGETSAAFLIVQRAQQKEELRTRLQEVKESVVVSKMEVGACAGTLSHVARSNKAFRETYVRATGVAERGKEVLERTVSLDRERKQKARSKMELGRMEEEIEKLTSEMSQLDSEKRRLEIVRYEKRDCLRSLRQELSELDRRLSLAESTQKRLSRDLRLGDGAHALMRKADEGDVEIRDLQFRNKLLLSRIGNICQKKPEIRAAAERLFLQASLSPTLLPPSSSQAEEFRESGQDLSTLSPTPSKMSHSRSSSSLSIPGSRSLHSSASSSSISVLDIAFSPGTPPPSAQRRKK